MSGIPVFSAGTSLQSSGASVSAQIPADSAGMLPLFVRVTATAAGYFRLSQDGASASIGDLLIQPSDGLILKTCGLSQFSFVSQSGASTVTVTPIDVGGIKYPTNIFTPAALFTTGINGAWYDPSDFSTMFQNAAGTTPVTAVGQPVGLMLDKSKGLVLGNESAINGTFTTDTNWVKGSGCTISGESLNYNGTAGTVVTYQSTPTLTIGKTYLVTYTITNYVAGNIDVRTGSGGLSVTASANGTYSRILTCQTSAYIYVTGYSGFNGSVSRISVRELPGNHAFNPSGNSANFPVLSARYNLLTKTEQFDDNTAWSKTYASVTPNAAATTDPLGGNTADALYETATNGVHRAAQAYACSATAYRFSIYVKSIGGRNVNIEANSGSAGAYTAFDLSNGSLLSSGTYGSGYAIVGTPTATAVGNGWYLIVLTASIPSATVGFWVGSVSGTSSNFAGDITKGIYLWGADLRVANDALNQPAYQRVNTTTDYDTVGFKPYLSFNGVNQWLQTNSIDFTYGDKMFVSAGVRRNTANEGLITENSAASWQYAGAFGLGTTAAGGFFTGLSGSVLGGFGTFSKAAPTTDVLTAAYDIASSVRASESKLRVNGSDVVQTFTGNDAGTGNYGNYPLYIGARAGSSLWFNGRLYGLVVAGKQASASEITSTETYLNNKTGAY